MVEIEPLRSVVLLHRLASLFELFDQFLTCTAQNGPSNVPLNVTDLANADATTLTPVCFGDGPRRPDGPRVSAVFAELTGEATAQQLLGDHAGAALDQLQWHRDCGGVTDKAPGLALCGVGRGIRKASQPLISQSMNQKTDGAFACLSIHFTFHDF